MELNMGQRIELRELIDQAELERVRQPLGKAWTLPPKAYTEAAVFAAEVEGIFNREWICVGRIDQVAEPGDFMCVDLISQPIVITRDRSGELHALSRVCVHRGMPVVEGAGNTNLLTCPYHKWVYELDGNLRGAPMMEGVEDFDERSCRLPGLALEVWEGFIFVNLNADAEPLAPQLTGLDELVGSYHFGDLVVAETVAFDSPWNWKILVENFMEAYHHIGTHKETLEPVYPSRQSSVPDNGGQPWSFLWMPSVDGVPEEESVFPELSESQRSGLFAAAIMPNFLFAASAHNGIWYQLEPRGHDAMDLKIHVLLPKVVAESLSVAEKKGIGELVSVIHREDIAANEGPWRGLHGALTTQGRLSTFEKAIWQLNQYWLDRLAG
jgi:phenylpropionate dioxygenase-like ring-hydroxylating dioxygenase large terminal subunit